jgi:hypothetical protein
VSIAAEDAHRAAEAKAAEEGRRAAEVKAADEARSAPTKATSRRDWLRDRVRGQQSQAHHRTEGEGACRVAEASVKSGSNRVSRTRDCQWELPARSSESLIDLREALSHEGYIHRWNEWSARCPNSH